MKSLDKKKTSELFEGVGSSLHQSFVGAVERDKEPKELSACCNAEVATANSGLVGETNYYICTKCHNDCDVIAEPKELDWEEKTYKFIKNILLDAEEKKVPHPVLISQIFSLLTQQRTELLEEINKDKRYSLQLVDKDGIIKENIGLFVIDGKLSPMASYNNGLGLRPVIKKYTNLLNKKYE